jgi:glyoxylase-like metal-dependent hydrolase (beta-lactamase superfamily II)
VQPASDVDRIASNIAIWHEYDSAVKAELYSTCLATSGGTYFIDPIPLKTGPLFELIGSNSVAGIIVTNGNHHRASVRFAEQFSVPIFAHLDTFAGAEARGARPSILALGCGERSSATPNELLGGRNSGGIQAVQRRSLADGDEIFEGLRAIRIEGAVEGEIALHYAPDGGTFTIGDALINFEPYGFTFLPAKYSSNQEQMRRSLRKLLDYKAERMFFAHGTPILSEAGQRLRGLIDSAL